MALSTPETNDFGIRLVITATFQSTGAGTAQDANIEIQRTLSSTGADTIPSTDWRRVATVPSVLGAGVTWDDILPNDGVRRWYRVRHTQTNWSPSTFLATVLGARPAELNSGQAF